MLNLQQLANRVAEVATDPLRLGEFEDWFRDQSRDVHLWGDEQLNDAVFGIEDVLSQYHFEGLRGNGLTQELEKAMRPFVAPLIVVQSGSKPQEATIQIGTRRKGPQVVGASGSECRQILVYA